MEKKLTSENIYEGRVIRVTKDQVLCENGLESTRECVSAPGGVAILAIQNNKILLVRQYRYVIQQDTLEIPAGKIEPNEELKTCALRELEEETGYRTDRMEKIFTFFPTPGFCSEVLHIYEANQLQKLDQPKAMDEDENIECIWMSLDDAYEAVLNGTIQDSKTMIAIMYAVNQIHKINL